MNRTKLLLITLVTSFYGVAQKITPETAEVIAEKFIGFQEKKSVELVFDGLLPLFRSQQAKHIYQLHPESGKGFVLVSNDLRVVPILGYSLTDDLNTDSLPPDLYQLLVHMDEEIDFISNHFPETTFDKDNIWSKILTDQFVYEKNVVAPMLTTTWSQRPYYNAQTPVPGGGGTTPVGCVATAMSQIMKFHNFPSVGASSNNYASDEFGTLGAQFGNTKYKWSAMPNFLNASSNQTQIQAVAELMYHAGLAVNMNYTSTGSSAYVSAIPVALRNYFNYSSSISIKDRANYTLNEWISIIKTDLLQGRPVLHSGYCPNPAAGHAFVIDGVDASNNFHINWGWGGSANGYFQINNLNPSSYTFNSNQMVITNIVPAGIQQLTLNTSLNSPTSITQNTPFTFSFGVKNSNTSTFSGKVKVEIIDDYGMTVSTLYTTSTVTIPAGSNYTVNLPNTIISNLTGNFKIVAFASSGNTNKWMRIENGSYTNPKTIKIVSPYNDLKVSANSYNYTVKIVKNTNTSIGVQLKNTSATNYQGNIRATLVDSRGTTISTLNTSTVSINAGATYSYLFSSSYNISKGTYYIVFSANQSGTYRQLNATTASVPQKIRVIIQTPASSAIMANKPVIDASQEKIQWFNLIENSLNTTIQFKEPGRYTVSLVDRCSSNHSMIDLTDAFIMLSDSVSILKDDKGFVLDITEPTSIPMKLVKASLLDELTKVGIETELEKEVQQLPENDIKIGFVYPTIVSDYAKIKLEPGNELQSVVISDQTGKQVFVCDNIDSFNEYNWAYLNNGVFFVRISTNKGITTNKIIKQ